MIPKSQEVKDKIKTRLLQAFMFSGLEDSEMEIVINAMDQKKCPQGEVVIKEGDKGDVLYVVESGKLDCTKVIDGNNTHLKNYQPGDAFGELALLYNAPRAATITASQDCELWVLDRATFNHIVKDASE